MRFHERLEFHYDAAAAALSDTQTALGLHAEYIKMNTPVPMPKVFEVDRQSSKYDPLWHVPLDERTPFARTFDLPMLVKAEKLDMRYTRVGIVPQQRCKFWMANLHLEEADWFPMRGDYIFWNGYRNMIINVNLEPTSFWNQTNVWLGLSCDTIIPAEGDARPLTNMAEAVPRELRQTRPVPEV